MWHWDDVSVNEQEDREIVKSIILWSSNIFEGWGKNEIKMQCVQWHYYRRKMWCATQSRKMFADCSLELSTFLNDRFLTNQLHCKDDVL